MVPGLFSDRLEINPAPFYASVSLRQTNDLLVSTGQEVSRKALLPGLHPGQTARQRWNQIRHTYLELNFQNDFAGDAITRVVDICHLESIDTPLEFLRQGLNVNRRSDVSVFFTKIL